MTFNRCQINDCLDLLKAVEAKTYVRKDLPDDGRPAGFIAQDFVGAAPLTLGSNLVCEIDHGDIKLNKKPCLMSA